MNLAIFDDIYNRAISHPRGNISPEIKGGLQRLYSALTKKPIDLFCMDEGWSDFWDSLPEPVVEILSDMSGALHDTVDAPDVAENFDSTPEQLLKYYLLLFPVFLAFIITSLFFLISFLNQVVKEGLPNSPWALFVLTALTLSLWKLFSLSLKTLFGLTNLLIYRIKRDK